MTIEQAIKKAIEGGWQPVATISIRKERFGEPEVKNRIVHLPIMGNSDIDGTYMEFSQATAFLDPLFWQSLGKAMGWKSYCNFCGDNKGFERDTGNMRCISCNARAVECEEEGWVYKWHRFIDHLAEGKTAETFFETLK